MRNYSAVCHDFDIIIRENYRFHKLNLKGAAKQYLNYLSKQSPTKQFHMLDIQIDRRSKQTMKAIKDFLRHQNNCHKLIVKVLNAVDLRAVLNQFTDFEDLTVNVAFQSSDPVITEEIVEVEELMFGRLKKLKLNVINVNDVTTFIKSPVLEQLSLTCHCDDEYVQQILSNYINNYARKFTKLEIHSLGFDVLFDRRTMKVEGIFEVPNFIINLINLSMLENLEELEIEGSGLIEVNYYLFVQCVNLIK